MALVHKRLNKALRLVVCTTFVFAEITRLVTGFIVRTRVSISAGNLLAPTPHTSYSYLDMCSAPSYKLFINNEWRDAKSGATFESLNPANEEVIAICASGQAEDVDAAVKAAKACFEGPDWGLNSTGKKRAACLRALGKAVEAEKEEIIGMESEDSGKPLSESEADVDQVLELLEYYADLAEKLDAEEAERIKVPMDEFETRVVKEPLGVIGAITPWNYPLLMTTQKAAAALAAGCTIIVKPSELAPLTTLRLVSHAPAAGFPPGAFNVVTGLGVPAGSELSKHPDIDKISFTGSVLSGQKVMMAAAAAGPNGVGMELGGKSPMIVFDDVKDLKSTVDWICMGIFYNAGQVCSATSRLLVHSKIYDEVVKMIVDRAENISVGNPMRGEDKKKSGAFMGPLVSALQRDKVLGFIDRAKGAGAKVLCGGGPPSDADANEAERTPGKGYYISPTVLVNVKKGDEAWEEEIFGPVLCVNKFDDEAEAVAEANRSQFGLAASVMSANKERNERIARKLRAGVVWQNCSQPAFIQAPWGGYKKSGFGRELGRWGFEEFQGIKQITACAGDYSFEWYGKPGK